MLRAGRGTGRRSGHPVHHPVPVRAPRVLPWNAGRLAASLVASERFAALSASLVIG